jgi:hypothetical protein
VSRGRLLLAVLAVEVALLGGARGGEPGGVDGATSDRPIVRRGARTGPARAFKRSAEQSDDTRCAACHDVVGWNKVRFNHDPTGFPLRGAHRDVTCSACHVRGYDVPVADTCNGCHRDRHGGELGMHCEGCHDDRSWQPFFQADAHRMSGFPLVGRHALIPCQECHGNMRDRTFSRAPIACVSCHQADFQRAALTSIDHVAAGFGSDCQSCHQTWRFWPARFARHDGCFRISAGSHQGIRCLGCHSSLPAAAFASTCSTGTFGCASCHSHACAKSDQQHKTVMGYECRDGKCYECHQASAR